jgi:hypothetical protein
MISFAKIVNLFLYSFLLENYNNSIFINMLVEISLLEKGRRSCFSSRSSVSDVDLLFSVHNVSDTLFVRVGVGVDGIHNLHIN